MTSNPVKPPAEPDGDRAIQQEILAGRSFSIAEAIGREGGDFMKGVSPVPPLVQARTEIMLFITQNLSDSSGALQAILSNWVKSDEAFISSHLDTPLIALREIIHSITGNSQVFYEFVRQVDVKWGQMNDERPHFQAPGQPPHPDDEYTHESVQQQLVDFLQRLETQI